MNILINQESGLIDFDLLINYCFHKNNISNVIYTTFPVGSYLIYKYDINRNLLDYRFIESNGTNIITMINPPCSNFDPLFISVNNSENNKCTVIFNILNFQDYWKYKKVELY